MNMQTVSVIIPAYNAASTIGWCLDSILSAGHPNLDIIVVDDASTDSTVAIASSYGVRVIKKTQNQGAGHSRNVGARNAVSDIIIFVDSDTVVPSAAIPLAVRSLTEKTDILAVGGAYSSKIRGPNFISDFKNMDLAYRANLEPRLLKYTGSYFLAMKKRDFEQAGGFSEVYLGATVEDIDFCYRLTRGKNRIYLETDIRVGHLKRYTLITLLKTDFQRIIGMSGIIKHSKGKYLAGSEIPFSHILNIFLPWTILFSPKPILPVAITVFFLNNFQFLVFLYKNRGLLFCIKSALALFIEYIVVGAALLSAFFKRSQKIKL